MSNDPGTDPDFDTIDYAIYGTDNNLYVFEEGSNITGIITSYLPSDILSVENDGSVVRYLKNGIVIYTSLTAPSGTYRFDCSVHTQNLSITNIGFEGVSPNLVLQTSDTFTGTIDTSIASHTPNLDTIGTGWTANAAYSPPTLDGTGKLKFPIRDSAAWIDIGASDQTVTSQINAGGADNRFSILVRSDSSSWQAGSYYFANIQPGVPSISINKVINGASPVGIGTVAPTLSATTTHTYEVSAIGNTISVKVDGTLVNSVVDTDIVSGTHAGLAHNLQNTFDMRVHDFNVAVSGLAISGTAPLSSNQWATAGGIYFWWPNPTQVPGGVTGIRWQRYAIKDDAANITANDFAGPFTVEGAQGQTGQKGAQGVIGVKGVQGIQGAQGAPGLKGEVGLKGDLGVKGAQGGKGDIGVKGAQGAQGFKGELGLKGDLGVKGLQGPQGGKGDIGVKGAQGAQGGKGDIGVKGDEGLKGLQGSQGGKGDIGVKGAQGAQGGKGDIGVKGDEGLKGLQGSQGGKGDIGVKGAQGAQGGKGEVGLKGDLGVKGLQGPQGGKGDIGVKGAQGAPGLKGELGLKGDLGVKGAQGAQGGKGDLGPKGDEGLKGLQGPTGFKGITGPTGDAGASIAMDAGAAPVANAGKDAQILSVRGSAVQQYDIYWHVPTDQRWQYNGTTWVKLASVGSGINGESINMNGNSHRIEVRDTNSVIRVKIGNLV